MKFNEYESMLNYVLLLMQAHYQHNKPSKVWRGNSYRQVHFDNTESVFLGKGKRHFANRGAFAQSVQMDQILPPLRMRYQSVNKIAKQSWRVRDVRQGAQSLDASKLQKQRKPVTPFKPQRQLDILINPETIKIESKPHSPLIAQSIQCNMDQEQSINADIDGKNIASHRIRSIKPMMKLYTQQPELRPIQQIRLRQVEPRSRKEAYLSNNSLMRKISPTYVSSLRNPLVDPSSLLMLYKF